MEFNNGMYAVSQSHCGHEYCWIFDGPTLKKHIGALPEGKEILCEDIFWPMGGSNSSATWIRKLDSLDEAREFLVNENPGPDSEDPMMVDIAEYLRTVDVEEDSITQQVLDQLGLKAEDLTQHDERYDELINLGYTPECFYDDKMKYTRYSAAVDEMTIRIDRSKYTIPEGTNLYKLTLTYGAGPWNVYAATKTEREAKKLAKNLYDYLGNALKILSVEQIETSPDIEYDATHMHCLGNINIIERRYRVIPGKEE